MSTKTYNGDENLLFIINEKFFDFDELKDKDFDLMKTISKQKLKGYFDILHGPIYTNLITKFWLNVSVIQSGPTIQSNVYGFPITIIPSLIAQTIKCEEKCTCVEHYRFNNVFSIHPFLIYANYNKLTNFSTLIPIVKF
ncbi:unnamed protein product [Lathyrus oleraceus]